MSASCPARSRVITGGARGLGRGYALRLAGLGADIAIIDRNLQAADVYEFERSCMTAPTVMAECEAQGVRAIGHRGGPDEARSDSQTPSTTLCGISDGSILPSAMLAAAPSSSLTNDNRARAPTRPATPSRPELPSDIPEEMLTRVLDINLKTTMYTCMAVAPHMKRQGGGQDHHCLIDRRC